MSQAEEFVEDFLAHYASEYYDPVKAREYYLKNRQLKGKRSSAALTVKTTTMGKRGKLVTKVNRVATDRRKQAWEYAKNQIGTAKKADLKKASQLHAAVVKKAQATATARRAEISSKLKTLLSTLTTNKSKGIDKIDADAQAKIHAIREATNKQIDAIPQIPKGIGGAQRKRLVAIRAAKIARLNGDADQQIQTVSADTTTQKKALAVSTVAERATDNKTATATRQKVATDLKASVNKAKADYEAGKKQLIAKYEAKSQKEFDAIKAHV